MAHYHRRALLAGATALTLAASVRHAAAQAADSGPYKLDPLPYPVTANEPHIDAKTMEIHHGKHHQAYVTNLNAALKNHPDLAQKPLHELLAGIEQVPQNGRAAIRNNGGGHANHTMFWQVMGGKGGEPTGEVKAAVERDFGSFDKMKSEFNGAGARRFGSGWVFVTVDKAGKLAITSKPNQDTPLMDGERVLFGNDVWEHAYYLTYQNRRPDYLAAWWNVVDWSKIAERYAAAKAGTLTI